MQGRYEKSRFSTDISLYLFVPSVSSGFASWKEFGDQWMLKSMKTLVHAFVTSRVDYRNITLVGAPKSVTNKLQRVLNAAARIVTGTRKYDQGLSHLLHTPTELHWLDVPERVLYKLALMVHRCLQDKAPQYLSNYCVPVSEVASRQQLRLPLVISFYWSHDIVSEHSVIELLLWLARRSGTHWHMNCELTLVIGLN